MNRSYPLNPVCPKFILNKRVYRKIAIRLFEVLLYLKKNIVNPGPEVIKLFSYSTQLSTQNSIEYGQLKKFLSLCLSDVVIVMLINV